MESLAGYGSDDESNEMLQDNKESCEGGSVRVNKQEDDVNYDNVQMDMSEESNNNHTSGSSSSSSSDTSSSSSDSESDSDSEKHSSSSSSHTFSSGDERERRSPKTTAPEAPVTTSDETSNVAAVSENEKDRHEPEDGTDTIAERCSNSLQNPNDEKKHAHSSEDKKRSHSPDRQKHSHSPNTHRRRSRSPEKGNSRGSAKRRSRSRSRDRRRRGNSSRSPERRKRSSPSHRSRSDRKRTSHSPSERRRRSRSADRKKRSHSPSSRSHRGGDRERERDRRSRSPAHRRPYEKKPNKLTILERLGIEIKAPNDPTAQPVTPQQLLQRSAEEQARQIKSTTGIEFPKYYNPAAMNPARYAEQMQKRRLLWGNKLKTGSSFLQATTSTAKADAAAPQTSTNKWEGTTFAQDQDGKMTAKFKRLMGIKDTTQGSSGSSATEGNEILKKQEEMFNSMEMQYEVARVATHTHRGVGLGFGTFQYPR